MVDNARIAAALDEIGTVLEILGGEPFRARAFRNAARTIEEMEEDIAEVVAGGRLGDLRGVGASIGAIVGDLVRQGRSTARDEILAMVPGGLLDLLRVPGLGPKRVRTLWRDLGIASLGELEYACVENRLAALTGFGARMQAKVRRGVAFVRAQEGRYLLSEGLTAGEEVAAILRGLRGVMRVEVGGEVRRMVPLVSGTTLVVAADGRTRQAVIEALAVLPSVEVEADGSGTVVRAFLPGGLPVRVAVVAPEGFPVAWLQDTGSASHVEALVERARGLGLALDAHRLRRGGRALPILDEEGIYGALGLAFVPPERREGCEVSERASVGGGVDLVRLENLRGVLHVHTTWSDGSASLREMVVAARRLGYAYVGIADHSQAAGYAGGLRPDRVRAQHREIDALQEEMGDIRILKGVEADILKDGGLDYDERSWRGFDFIVGSVHSVFEMDGEAMTARILRAMENPYLSVLGHPTGRLLRSREGYAVDMDAILVAAARRGVVVEINANPHRLDLDPAFGPRARELGVRVAVNPDAHAVEGLGDVRYGVGVARRAGFAAADVVNTREAEDLLALFAGRRA